MKLRNLAFITLLSMLLGIMIIGCESPPDQEIMDAEDAIKRAMTAGADELSPKLYDAAMQQLQDAKMLSEQENYEGARKKAAFAVIKAKKAEKNAIRLSGVEPEESATDDQE